MQLRRTFNNFMDYNINELKTIAMIKSPTNINCLNKVCQLPI